MNRFLFAFLMLFILVAPAEAHRLKVFATVEGDAIRGYAFFVGGGRSRGSSWTARDGADRILAEGTTDAQGGFTFAVPKNTQSDVTITVDTHEAHIASATIRAARLGGAPSGDVNGVAESAGSGGAESGTVPASSPTDAQIAALVEAAVQRQVEPLLERIEQMDSRLRIVDILSGVFFIAGLAGVGLWARSRRH